MESLYQLPYEKFRHVTTAGTPHQVTEWLSAYVDGGVTSITLALATDSVHGIIDAAAEVRCLLQS